MKSTPKSLIAKIQKSEQNKNNLISNVKNLQKSCSTLKKVNSNVNNATDILEALFSVFKESIEDMEDDKEYMLAKLEMFNDMGEALSDYLHEINEAAQEVSEEKDGEENNSEILIKASINKKREVEHWIEL